MQQAGAVEQVELGLHQLGQIGLIERAVVIDELAHNASRVRRRQAEQVAYDGARRFAIHLDPASLFVLPGGRFAAQDAGEFLDVGQGERHAQRKCFELFRQLDLGADQHDGVRGRVLPLHDLAQHAQGHGIAQKGVEVEQQKNAGLAGVPDGFQRGGGVRSGVAVLREVEPAQTVGEGPAPQRAQRLCDHVSKAVDHPLFVDGFDHQQRRARARQRGEVLQLAHEAPFLGAGTLTERRVAQCRRGVLDHPWTLDWRGLQACDRSVRVAKRALGCLSSPRPALADVSAACR
jgi:hypothetical protein